MGDLRQQDRSDLRQQDRGDLRQQDRDDLRQQDRSDLRQQDRSDLRQQDRGDLRQQDMGDLRQQDRGDLRQQDRCDPRQQDRGDLRQQDMGDLQQQDRGDLRQQDMGDLRQQDRGDLRQQDMGDLRQQDRGDLRQQDRGDLRQQDRGDLQQQDRGDLRQQDWGDLRQQDRGDLRQQDRGFIKEFIEIYKTLPCLWKVKSEDYSNRCKKTKAYDTLIKKMTQVDSNANRDTVVKKINSLRSCYRKELKKVNSATEAREGDEYTPQLWYFKLLHFLRNQDLSSDESFNSNTDDSQYARIQDEVITDLRQQDRGFLTEFIEIYRSLPCLWKVKSKEYSNRHMKTRAYETLIKKFRQVDPNANRDTIVKKINSLRSCHRKELKKVNDSLLTGAMEEDVHTPHLWYFDLLNFLRDQEQDVSSESMSIADEYMDEDSQEEKYVPRRFESLKRKASISEDNYLPLESCTLPVDKLSSEKTNLELNEYEAVGISVAKKLQRMDATQAIFAESLIHLVLRRGLLQSLTENTDLHDDFS